jgi:hypothetical protein
MRKGFETSPSNFNFGRLGWATGLTGHPGETDFHLFDPKPQLGSDRLSAAKGIAT